MAAKPKSRVGISRGVDTWIITGVGVTSDVPVVAELPQDAYWTPKRVERLAKALTGVAW